MGKRIFFGSFLCLFLCFFILYIVGLTGYFDYKQHEKMIITKENMEIFEQDIESGKNVDIENYITYNEYDYNNSVSRFAISLSNNIEKYSKIVLGGIFKAIGEVVK